MTPRRRKPWGQLHKVEVPIQQHTGPTPGPEVHAWFWCPQREGAKKPPSAFAAKLHDIDKDLDVCYSPIHQRWLLWVKNPRMGKERGIPDWVIPGWQLLMVWETPETKQYLPLTELMFHNIYLITRGRAGNAKQYYDRIQANIEREKASRDKHYTSERQAQQNEFRQSFQINSAGSGNKFALYHDGTMVPSPGAANWRKETKRKRLGAEHLKQEAADKEKAFYS